MHEFLLSIQVLSHLPSAEVLLFQPSASAHKTSRILGMASSLEIIISVGLSSVQLRG